MILEATQPTQLSHRDTVYLRSFGLSNQKMAHIVSIRLERRMRVVKVKRKAVLGGAAVANACIELRMAGN